MISMLNCCSRSGRAFILTVVVLFCSFPEMASASRRSGSIGPMFALMSFVTTTMGIVYVLRDERPVFEIPSYDEISPKFYLKYESRVVNPIICEVVPNSEKANLEVSQSQQVLNDRNENKRPDSLIIPVQLTAVPAAPEIFDRRNNNTPITEEMLTGSIPDNWNAYFRDQLFWSLHPFFVELGRDHKKMRPFYRPILSACLDLTGKSRFAVKGLVSQCVNAASSRLKRTSTSAGIHAIGDERRVHDYSESARKVRLPVYSVLNNRVVKVDWELFYISLGDDGGYNVVSVKKRP